MADASPPAMIASVPPAAAAGPPDTGASMKAMPDFAVKAAATRLVVSISVVEWSTSTLPSSRPAEAMPSSPRIASSTAAVVVTDISTMSAARATSAGDGTAARRARRLPSTLSAAMS